MALTADQITAQNFKDFYDTILPYLNGGGMGMKLLWENPEPTQSFAAQDVTLSSDDYDFLLVLDMLSSTFNGTGCNISPKGSGGKNDLATFASSTNGTQTWVRFYTYVDDTTIHFQDAIATCGSSSNTDNTKIIPYRIYGIKVYNREGGGISAEDYTTSEKAIGTWIDGKTLYQKVIDCGALPNNTRKEVAHNITNMDMYFIKNAFAYKSGASFAMNMYDLDYPAYSVRISMNATNVQIYTKADMSSYTKSYAVVCYTKTS